MPEDFDDLVRSDLKKMVSYTPIEPIDVLSDRLEASPEHIIKLDGNENPYGCSPEVKEALGTYSYYHIYPDPEQRELRKALGEYINIKSDYIIAGSGSDELIDLILRLTLQPGEKVINCPPTFGMYTFCTDICGGAIANIPRMEDFSLDIDAVEKKIDKTTKVMFIASPNNPTGNVVPEKDILRLLKKKILVVVDEAYVEFSDTTVSHLVPKYPNLIVLRTFSKWAGLAGLRMGFGIFPSHMVKYLMKIKQPYNVNSAAQVAALASLKDIAYLRSTINDILTERERLAAKLSEFDWLTVYPSRANFLLCSFLEGKAKQIYHHLQKEGIFIRYFDTPRLQDCIRISVGRPEHTDKLINALKHAF
jgi:histidinol-phosphate aminotransferase